MLPLGDQPMRGFGATFPSQLQAVRVSSEAVLESLWLLLGRRDGIGAGNFSRIANGKS